MENNRAGVTFQAYNDAFVAYTQSPTREKAETVKDLLRKLESRSTRKLRKKKATKIRDKLKKMPKKAVKKIKIPDSGNIEIAQLATWPYTVAVYY